MPRKPPPIIERSRSGPFSLHDIFVPDDEDSRPPAKAATVPSRTALDAERLRRLVAEYASRQAEALRIYRPLPSGLAFHKSQAKERLVVGSNRAGKSQCCGAEMAWWLMGCHPYRKTPKENGRFVAVGWDWDHISRVMWPKLGRPGSFKMIRDEITKEWRPAVPDQEYDAAYREKWRDAPPFLPPRWIKRISWEKKNTDQPSHIWCVNGSTLQFASSQGAAKQGDAIHGWWVDEEIQNELWVKELQRGCTSTGGGGFYSATPLAQSIQLFEMHRRALDPKNKTSIEEFHLSIADNIYISNANKKEFYDQLLTPADIMVRWHGQFSMNLLTVYPEFNPDVHVIQAFEPDYDWTRYMVVDPGTEVCAVLFAAVPPPTDRKTGQPHPNAGELHIYHELYIERCTASLFAEQVARAMGQAKRGDFEAFIIDHRMGRQSDVGSGRSVEVQYSDALVSQGVYSRATGSGFLWGSDDVRGREMSLRRLMMPRRDSDTPPLRIHSTCRKLIWELPQQFFRKGKDGQLTDKRRDAHDHATTSLEYLAAYEPSWVRPDRRRTPNSPAYERVRAKKRAKSFNGDSVISLGPKD